MISIVVAMARNRAIGLDNQLLWHIAEDMKFFKSLTSGGTVVMGRKTYDSIGRPLPNRRNIVITRNADFRAEGVEVVSSIEAATKLAELDEKVFIIGGGEIYRQAIDLVDTLYVTLVDRDYEADTFFPTIDEKKWSVDSRLDYERGAKFEYPFSFITFRKI